MDEITDEYIEERIVEVIKRLLKGYKDELKIKELLVLSAENFNRDKDILNAEIDKLKRMVADLECISERLSK